MVYPRQPTTFASGTVFTSAWGNWINQKAQEFISVKDYGATGDGSTDDTVAIQAAIAAAEAVTNTTIADPYGNIILGGGIVYFPPGIYKISSECVISSKISLIGHGSISSVIKVTQNSRGVTQNPVSGQYNGKQGVISNLGFLGDRTKTSQDILNLLRPLDGNYNNIYILNAGRDGLVIREGLACSFNSVVVYKSGRRGISVLDGVDAFSTAVPTNYPTNNCRFDECHAGWNDGPGLYLGGDGTITLGKVNGCQFVGCTFEYNYFSSSAGTGYNVEDYSTSYFGNILENTWLEATATKAHIYKQGTDVSQRLFLKRVKHTSNGAAAWPERFVINVTGQVVADSCEGLNNLYRTVGGSNTPYRLTKATARIDLINPLGSSITNDVWVEDETNTTTGLYNNVKYNNFNTVRGPFINKLESTEIGFEGRVLGDTYSFFQLAGDKSVRMGDATASPGFLLKATSSSEVAVNTGILNAGGTWNASHLKLGTYHIWVDSSGRLRIKSTAPTSDTDGTVVGTQV